jgi:signal peptidase I
MFLIWLLSVSLIILGNAIITAPLITGIFKKAGVNPVYSFIPIYNYYIWISITKKPKWWIIWSVIPYVNIILGILLAIETTRFMGRTKTKHYVLAILPIFNIVYLLQLGANKTLKWNHSYVKTKSSGDWVEAILFALVAASIIRTFTIEAYTIPTPSMEKTLLVNDFLFVSKLDYGPRVPMTPLAIPLVHNTTPILNTKSYLEFFKLPYLRLPGWTKIKNGDIVVFNYPREQERPIDKRDNYIKRCVAIPGDTMQIIKQQIFINNKPLDNPEEMQYLYRIFLKSGVALSPKTLDKMGIKKHDRLPDRTRMIYHLTKENANELVEKGLADSVVKISKTMDPEILYSRQPFPNDIQTGWNVDDYGPLVVPKAGMTIELTPRNVGTYRMNIEEYEGRTIQVSGNSVLIDGVEAKEYTFTKNYYFMCGDNRHNSEDSRFWGFVPEDHIVGKPWIIWFSIDNDFSFKVRFNRLFKSI